MILNFQVDITMNSLNISILMKINFGKLLIVLDLTTYGLKEIILGFWKILFGVKISNLRIIARLDIKSSNLIKPIQLEGLRVVGNPNEFAKKYYENNIDELLFVDNVASLYQRSYMIDIIRKTVEDIFIPITVGGGIKSIHDVETLLKNGADKVAINTAAVKNPILLKEISREFGSSTLVLYVEAKKISNDKYEVFTNGGRERSYIAVEDWILKTQEYGIGEILLTSIDQEGTRKGFDLNLVKKVFSIAEVPLIVNGGYGKENHLINLLNHYKISGVAIADAFHFDRIKIDKLKQILDDNKFSIRRINWMNDVLIVDYGLGNLKSIYSAIKKLGHNPMISREPKEIVSSSKVILPGVGAFSKAMKNLDDFKLLESLEIAYRKNIEILGICLGMQLFFENSEEFGYQKGLGFISGKVVNLNHNLDNKILTPNIGWLQNSCISENKINLNKIRNISSDKYFYFVHSFHCLVDDNEAETITAKYGNLEFTSVVTKRNLTGFQFHPENSGIDGLKILKNWIEY